MEQRTEVLRQTLEDRRRKAETFVDELGSLVSENWAALEAGLELIIQDTTVPAPEEGDAFARAIRGTTGRGRHLKFPVLTLRELRGKRGLREIADEIGIPYPHLSLIERGKMVASGKEEEAIEQWAGKRLRVAHIPYFEVEGEAVDDEEEAS